MTGRCRGYVSPAFYTFQATAAVVVLLATSLAFTAPLVAGFPTGDIDDVREAPPTAGDFGTIAVLPLSASTATAAAAATKTTPGGGSGRRDKIKTSASTSHGQATLLQQPVSSENVIRPLENIADRFLKSETVGVVDTIASQAIEAFARFVDGAGLVMVNIIDSLPGTIDRVADTVDGMVKTADDIGRNVAVIVTAPARIVLTGLNPDFNSTLTRRGAPNFIYNEVDSDSSPNRKNGTDKSLDNRSTSRRSSRRRQPSLLSNMFNQRRQSLNDRNSPLLSLFNRNLSNGSSSNINFSQFFSRSAEDFNSGSNVIRARTVGRSRADIQNDKEEASSSDILSARGLGRSLLRSSLISRAANQDSDNRSNRPLNLLGFGALGSALALNNRTGNRGVSSDEREKTVFEKNFEASKTQASIDKLEEEFGGFLGRLLGTIYRNADPIDESISGGLRRVLGAPPVGFNDRRNIFSGLGRSTSSGGRTSSSSAGRGSDVITTSTPPPVKFRLTFDDIDPAPARNADVTLP